jgi:sarcosine oxidase, subunit gamma
MSDPVSPLHGARFDGFAQVREIGPLGMIILRAKALKTLDKAIKAAVGTKVPGPRRIETLGDRACGWMSPDEYLLILPYAEVQQALAALAKALAKEHHLAADVSDARAVFRVEGKMAQQVLQKLMPVDFDRLAPAELRRTRMAQVAAAVWRDGDGFTVVCFRSVARYAFDLMQNAAGTPLHM